MDVPGFDSKEGNIFSSSLLPNRLWGLPSLVSNGYRMHFPLAVKLQRPEADHSPPSIAEVKNSSTRLHGVVFN
jgi:hypothetical protein